MELDPNSNFYRICPGCNKSHMVTNRGRDYCSEKCYQDHYNSYRKRIKAMDQASFQKNMIKNFVTPERLDDSQVLKKNIHILRNLLNESSESSFSVQQLDSLGFNFYGFSYHAPRQDNPKSFCIEYGPYETFLVTNESVFVRQKEISK
jgi:endogenous inhibitor of DNA gyrase (YacG/DUF329 family)